MSNEKISYEELLNILTQLQVTHDKETVGNWFMKVLKAQKHLNVLGEIKVNRDCMLHDEIIGHTGVSKPTGTEFVGLCTYFTTTETLSASNSIKGVQIKGTVSGATAQVTSRVVPFPGKPRNPTDG